MQETQFTIACCLMTLNIIQTIGGLTVGEAMGPRNFWGPFMFNVKIGE